MFLFQNIRSFENSASGKLKQKFEQTEEIDV